MKEHIKMERAFPTFTNPKKKKKKTIMDLGYMLCLEARGETHKHTSNPEAILCSF